MICATCGGDNREGARFCRHCGGALSESRVAEAGVGVEAGVGAELESQAGPPAEAEAEAKVEAAAGREAEGGVGPEAGGLSGEGVAGEPASREQAESPAASAGPAQVPPPESEAPPLASEVPPAEPAAEPPVAPVGEALAPLESGTVIAGRYVVVEVLEARPEEILYRARDLQRCWQCGFEGNAPDEAFCARCGADLSRKPDARLLQVVDLQAAPANGQVAAARFTDDGRAYLLLAEPQAPARPEVAHRGLRLVIGQCSDVGRVRELNEDSLLTLLCAPCYESRTTPLLGLFAVADGMGGHEGGELASRLALEVLAREVIRSVVLAELTGPALPEEEIGARLREAAVAANDAVYLARQKRGNDMGTTLTAALVRDDRLFLAHVGDSRAYRWNAEGLVQLTVDHSVVASMIASGRVRPEEIYTHPQRSVVYRCVGDQPLVDVDTATFPLGSSDRLILCSDGLWEMVRSEGIGDAMMEEADPQGVCDLLVKRANAAGGEDNISVVVVRVAAV